MAYKLYPPGTRNGNRHFVARGSREGKQREISTRTRDEGLARRIAQDFFDGHTPARRKKPVAAVIDGYISWRRPRTLDERNLLKLRQWFGNRDALLLEQHDLDKAAAAIWPAGTAATRNRNVYTPMSAALKHAGIHLPIRRPKQQKRRPNPITWESAQRLMAETTDRELRAFLALLFFTGCRISEAVALRVEDVDLAGKRIRFWLGKTRREHWRAIPRPMAAVLARHLADHAGGRLWRWETRYGAGKAIRLHCRKIKVAFWPHRARHTFASRLMAAGASVRDLMDAGGWEDQKSVLLYAETTDARVRGLVEKIGKR